MRRPRRGALLLWAGVTAIAVYPFASHVWFFFVLRSLNYNDFGKFYYSVRQWLDGGAMYGPSPATLHTLAPGRQDHLWNMNPPHFHFLIWPLVGLPVEQAYLAWAVFNVAVTAVALVAIARALRLGGGPGEWLPMLIVVSGSAPVLAWAITGQVTGLLVGAVTFVWLALRRGRWTSGAVALGLVCSVKPFLAPVAAYLLFRRQWRAALVAAVTLLPAFAAGLAVFGLQAHRDWLAALASAQWIGAVMNASVFGPASRAWSVDVIATAPAPHAVGAAIGALVLGIGLFAAWRSESPDRSLLILLLTSLLASPLGWVYYLPIVAGPLLAVWAHGQLNRWTYLALAALLVPQYLLYPFTSRAFAFTAGSLYTWSMLGLWVAALAPGRISPRA